MLAPEIMYILLQRPMIVFPVADTALPPDPFPFCIDAFNRGAPWYKGLCHENSVEAIASMERRRGVNGLIGGCTAVQPCIGCVRTDGFIRIELVEDGFAPNEGHGGRFIRNPVRVQEMDGRVPPIDHGEIRERAQPWLAEEHDVDHYAAKDESEECAHDGSMDGRDTLVCRGRPTSIFLTLKKLKLDARS